MKFKKIKYNKLSEFEEFILNNIIDKFSSNKRELEIIEELLSHLVREGWSESDINKFRSKYMVKAMKNGIVEMEIL